MYRQGPKSGKCPERIAVRGPFAAESRLLLLRAAVLHTARGRSRDECLVQVTFVHARHVMYTPISVFMQQGQKKTGCSQQRTRREPLLPSLRPWTGPLRSAPQKITLGHCNQPTAHPGKSQRRAAGDANDWLEPQLHVQYCM